VIKLTDREEKALRLHHRNLRRKAAAGTNQGLFRNVSRDKATFLQMIISVSSASLWRKADHASQSQNSNEIFRDESQARHIRDKITLLITGVVISRCDTE
jgi:hypothetical protein